MVYKNEQRKRETNTFTEKEGHVDVSGRPALLSSPFKAEGRAKFFFAKQDVAPSFPVSEVSFPSLGSRGDAALSL